MKWITLLPFVLLLTACGYYTNTEVVEYRQVYTTPTVAAVSIMDEDDSSYDPIDVTTTTVEYY